MLPPPHPARESEIRAIRASIGSFSFVLIFLKVSKNSVFELRFMICRQQMMWSLRRCRLDRRRAEPGQIRKERRHFERHLFLRRKQNHWLGLHHFQTVAPGIQLYPSAQRQSRDLVHAIFSSCGALLSNADIRMVFPFSMRLPR